ncbi:hypothetical protein PCE1_001084 [Barthelona sp. PCE]
MPSGQTRNREFFAITEDTAVETRVNELIYCFLPSKKAVDSRNFVERMLEQHLHRKLGFKLYFYGSTPLKTFLPSADVDCIIASSSATNTSSDVLKEVYKTLEAAAKDAECPIRVMDVQFIHATVPVVKCIVNNIFFDISSNQFAGLWALTFLEQVDRRLSRFHLFKRSIVLCKAWCHYQARILGSMNGMLSTYAVETILLRPFIDLELRSPFQVLCAFMSILATFNWDEYAYSVAGPVRKDELCNISRDVNGNQLYTKLPSKLNSFLKKGERLARASSGIRDPEDYGVLSEGAMAEIIYNSHYVYTSQTLMPQTYFTPREMDIIDPLNFCNNLGRSISPLQSARIKDVATRDYLIIHDLLRVKNDKQRVDLFDLFFRDMWMSVTIEQGTKSRECDHEDLDDLLYSDQRNLAQVRQLLLNRNGNNVMMGVNEKTRVLRQNNSKRRHISPTLSPIPGQRKKKRRRRD